jgi:hypothetical protein
MDERVIAAHHEAAHAVLALVLGQQVAFLSLTRSGGCLARCLLTEDSVVRARGMHPARAAVVRILAGRHGGRLVAPGWSEGDAVDRALAVKIFNDFLGGGRESFRELDREAQRLVGRYPRAVRRVAVALLRKGRLTGREVVAAAGPLVPPSLFGPPCLQKFARHLSGVPGSAGPSAVIAAMPTRSGS